MAQTLKPEVEARILQAGVRVFAEQGYGPATMASIAKAAKVATGNIYRYYENKDALFYAVLPDAFVRTFMRLVNKRVSALVQADELETLDPSAQEAAEELLRFWIENRLRVIILLDRAKGSEHEAFAQQFVETLARLATQKMKRDAPSMRVTPVLRFTLDTIFKNTILAIVSILGAHETEPQIREAFAGFWSYQLAGLAGLSKWASK